MALFFFNCFTVGLQPYFESFLVYTLSQVELTPSQLPWHQWKRPESLEPCFILVTFNTQSQTCRTKNWVLGWILIHPERTCWSFLITQTNIEKYGTECLQYDTNFIITMWVCFPMLLPHKLYSRISLYSIYTIGSMYSTVWSSWSLEMFLYQHILFRPAYCLK